MVNELSQPTLTSKLVQMKRQPFGILEDGTLVEEINGKLVTPPIEYMLELVANKVSDSLAGETSPEEVTTQIEEAQAEAVNRLVEMLNGAIIDDRFHVTADYILDINNNYSTEFWLFTIDYCRVISGDKDFYGNFSHRRIPEVVIKLFRPLSNAMIFQILPQIVRKFSKADVRTVQVRPTSAIFQWYGRRQDDPHLNEIHLTVSSHAYKNILSSVTNLVPRR
jgi:hypothetical protein